MKKRIPAFLSGALCAVLVLSLTLTALAVSGTVSFNGLNISLFGKKVVAAGDSYTGQNGAQVPSSITYTDELGGTTNYLSVRQVAELLDTDLYWSRATKTLVLGSREATPTGGTTIETEDGITISTGGTAEPVNAGPAPKLVFTEVEGKQPAADAKQMELLPKTRMQSDGRPLLRQAFECSPGNGSTISVTITNHNTESKDPLLFNVYQARAVGRDTSIGHTVEVAPGKTVTRTFQLDADAQVQMSKLRVDVLYAMDDSKTDLSITVNQFTP